MAFALAVGSIGISGFSSVVAREIPLTCFDDGAIHGTPGNDKLTGTKLDDVIFGGGGRDVIDGKGGNDLLCARGGNDLVRGGYGDDEIHGGGADDDLRGGPGDDTIRGGPGTDTLNGLAGTDSCDGETETNCEDASPSPSPSPTPTPTSTATPPAETTTPPATKDPGTNVGPTAENDSYSMDEDTTLDVAAPGVLGNDSDSEKDALAATAPSLPANGTLTLRRSGGMTYVPNANFTGVDTFTYTARDSSTASAPATVTITVNGMPDSPVAIAQTATTDEDTPKVLTLAATDPDGAAPSSFEITSLPGDGDLRNGSGLAGSPIAAGDLPYTLAGNQVTYVPDENFNGADDFDFKADDGALESTSAPVSLWVTPVNDQPVVTGRAFSLRENSPNGTTVGSASVADGDAGDGHTWSITNGNSRGAFAIAPATGAITVADADELDFEDVPQWVLTVTAEDNGSPTASGTGTVTINLRNVNEAPTDVTLSNASVAENEPAGTAVGSLGPVDPDASDTHTYSLVSGTGSGDNGRFQIAGGVLQTAESFDFETPNHPFSIRIRTTDAGNLTYEETFSISVTDANEAPPNQSPTDISLDDASVAENAPQNTVVGTISGTDPDAGDSLTFSLVSGVGAGDNSLFNVGPSNSLRTSVVFDKERRSSFFIRLRATDGGSMTYEEIFQVTIDDVNEAPTLPATPFAFLVGDLRVVENSATGAAVGRPFFFDPDVGQTFTWEILGGNTGGAFSIDQGSGLISVANPTAIDFESLNRTFTLLVRVTDSGTPALSAQRQVIIDVANDFRDDLCFCG